MRYDVRRNKSVVEVTAPAAVRTRRQHLLFSRSRTIKRRSFSRTADESQTTGRTKHETGVSCVLFVDDVKLKSPSRHRVYYCTLATLSTFAFGSTERSIRLRVCRTSIQCLYRVMFSSFTSVLRILSIFKYVCIKIELIYRKQFVNVVALIERETILSFERSVVCEE